MFLTKEARTAFMLGNEAIVRGALEADVKMVAFIQVLQHQKC